MFRSKEARVLAVGMSIAALVSLLLLSSCETPGMATDREMP